MTTAQPVPEDFFRRQSKYYEPSKSNVPVTIIGCGSLGGNIAVALAKMGLSHFTLYDFDRVEPHNIPNQPFTRTDIGLSKVEATAAMIRDSSFAEELTIFPHNAPWKPDIELQPGLIINAPDCILVRKEVFKHRPKNSLIIDVRSGPSTYDIYTCDTQKQKTIDFYKEKFFDPKDAVNAGCGAQSTVFGSLDITAVAVNLFMRWCKKEPIPAMTIGDLMTLAREQIYLGK